MEALTEPDETLARLGIITCAVGRFTDPEDCKHYPAGCEACYNDEEGGPMDIRNHTTGEIILLGDVTTQYPDWVYRQCGVEAGDTATLANMLDQYDISDFADADWKRDTCGVGFSPEGQDEAAPND